MLFRSSVAGGFAVTEAATGADAVRRAGIEHPDVIVLDLGLPDLAGEELVAAIREAAPESRIVVHTGTDNPAVAGQVAGYLVKGEDIGALVELVRSLQTEPAQQAVLDLPNQTRSVASARRFVAGTLVEWGLGHVVEAATLVVSELATNAVTHAASGCRLTVARKPDSVRIGVHDTGAGAPDPRLAAATDEHGRGLLIVSALTVAWGLEASPAGGKLVWAELAT